MAQAKVSQEALVKMAETLRQGAEGILSAKADMDSQLQSFDWDDPTGYYFKGKYEEDFKPLTEKLLPAIEEYVSYIAGLKGSVAEYSEVIVSLGALGAAAGYYYRKVPNSEEQSNVGSLKQQKHKKLLSSLSDPDNSDLTKEEHNQLKKDEDFKKIKAKYKEWFDLNEPDLEKGLTQSQIDDMNSHVFGLKENDLVVHFAGKDQLRREFGDDNYSEILGITKGKGTHSYINEEQHTSECGLVGTGAHEATHVASIIDYLNLRKWQKKHPNEPLTESQQTLIEIFEKKDNELWEENARMYNYAAIDACNEYVQEKYSKR